MKSLVTGGAGFIGSHLVESLVADGHQVIVLDNFEGGKAENLQHIANDPRLSVHSGDVADLDSIRPYFHGIQWVFHLAGMADIVPSIDNPLKYHHANVNGTVSVLEAARQAGVAKFLYAASSTCYGLPDQVRRDRPALQVMLRQQVMTPLAVAIVGHGEADVEMVSPAGQFKAVVSKASRDGGHFLQGKVGPLAGKKRYEAGHGSSFWASGLNISVVLLNASPAAGGPPTRDWSN